jgi:putative lipoic acid-binding regulatory protein
MSDDQPAFRDEIKHVVRRHDPDAETLRALAADLETLAERYEQTDEVL